MPIMALLVGTGMTGGGAAPGDNWPYLDPEMNHQCHSYHKTNGKETYHKARLLKALTRGMISKIVPVPFLLDRLPSIHFQVHLRIHRLPSYPVAHSGLDQVERLKENETKMMK